VSAGWDTEHDGCMRRPSCYRVGEADGALTQARNKPSYTPDAAE
jgi:hypothetical protein